MYIVYFSMLLDGINHKPINRICVFINLIQSCSEQHQNDILPDWEVDRKHYNLSFKNCSSTRKYPIKGQRFIRVWSLKALREYKVLRLKSIPRKKIFHSTVKNKFVEYAHLLFFIVLIMDINTDFVVEVFIRNIN